MLRKLKITESERKEILSIFNEILNEEDDKGTPIPCTIVDVSVVDESGNAVPNVKLKFYLNNELIDIKNGRVPKTDENGQFNNFAVDYDEGTFLSFDKNRLRTLEKEYYRNCGNKKTIKIETSYLKNKNTTEHEVCFNNGYLYNSDPEKLFRHQTALNTNKIEITIKVPVEPEKPLTQRACLKLTNKHYRDMGNVDSGNITISELGGVDAIKQNAEAVKNCYLTYRKDYPDREQKIINRLLNTRADLDFFEIKLTKQQVKDIYGESKSMSLNNTIRKVISESAERKNLLSEEKKLVENRLLFSLNGVRKNNINEAKTKLKNERVKLIRFGYDKNIVNESFLDVMKGLYGNDGTDVLTDIKTRLGQRIADQVKNKQEEHEMILSAFNDLPTEMIERAIKENRVDELSNEIATKALENYKTQFGTEGLSGIMIASVDENKFKQEVSKLIEPAIKDITTKMDEKLKQVQDAVSGGLNPTA